MGRRRTGREVGVSRYVAVSELCKMEKSLSLFIDPSLEAPWFGGIPRTKTWRTYVVPVDLQL